MLPKTYRLKRKKDFELVFKNGKELRECFLLVRFVENALGKNRFGIIITQKISKKATKRNKLKRQIKAVIKDRLPEMKKGFDFVFIARPGIENQNFWEIKETIDKIFINAKMINQK